MAQSCFLLFLLGATLAAYGQSSPDVLVYLVNKGSPTSFDGFVVDSVVLDVRRAGLESVTVPANAGDASLPDPADSQGITSFTRGQSAVLAVTGSYTIEGGQIDIVLRGYDAVDGSLVASTSRKAPIDLALDHSISDAMAELIPQLQERRAMYPGAPQPPVPRDTTPTPPPAVAEGEQEPAIEEIEAGLPGGIVERSPGSPIDRPPRGAEPARQATSRDRVAIGFGLTPFLTSGEYGAFFGFGVGPSLSASYLIPTTKGHFAIGLIAGAVGFRAEGPLETALGLLAPAGLELRYGVQTTEETAFAFHVAGGPALLGVNSPSEGTLTKLIPFGRAGVGFSRMLGPAWGLAFDASYQLYYESGEFLTGIAPEVHLFTRF